MITRNLNLLDFVVPTDFTENSKDKNIRIVAYSTISSNKNREFFHQKIDNSNIFLFYGSLPYYSSTTSNIVSTDKGIQLNINDCDDKQKNSPEGFWLILVIPYDSLSKPVDFIEDELVGFISVYFGTSYTYDVFFRNDYRYEDKRLMLFSRVINTPATITRVAMNKETIAYFRVLISRYLKLSDEKACVVLSCLRWYSKATGRNGVEGFIFLWTSLEVIGKDGTQKLRILKDKMINIYNIKDSDIENTFYIGHIESFRGKILHNGHDYPVNMILLEYLRCLIEDLLLNFIIGNKTKRALNYIETNRDLIIKAVS